MVHTVPCIHYFTILFATVPHPWTIHSSLYPPLRHTQPSHTAYFLLGFPLRLSHAHARLRPRKHLKRRRSAIARRTHPHAQFSAGVVIFKSAKPYGLTLSGRDPAFGAEAAHLVPGAPDSINRLRFYLPPLYGIAVLPCFSASGKVPVTRCGLPLRGTYAAYECPIFPRRARAVGGNECPHNKIYLLYLMAIIPQFCQYDKCFFNFLLFLPLQLLICF